MKLFMGFIILLVGLVAVTGCTQTAPSTVQVTTETTAVPTTEVTTEATTVATTVETTVPVTNTTIVANVTATPETNVTTVATEAPVNVTATVTAANQVTLIHVTKTSITPQSDVVLPGTRVSWVNDDKVAIAIKATGDSEGMFNSGDISPNGQFAFDFGAKTGTYTYALADNSSVSGTIIVKEGRTLTS